MADVPVRFILSFGVIKDAQLVDLKLQVNAPAEAHIPLPGDNVVVPKAVAEKAGFPVNVFVVAKRQFIYADLPKGVAGAAMLVLTQPKPKKKAS